MNIFERKLKGVFEIQLQPIIDQRGFFMRTFDKNLLLNFQIPTEWVQENHSMSMTINTIRGLHFILPPYTDAKLIRCIRGRIWDVFVDIRKDSPTFGKWDSIELSDKIYKLLYLPAGFAHGFCTLEENSEILYKHSTFYQNDFDCGIRWNDENLNIPWPTFNPTISQKDLNQMNFIEFKNKYGGL